MTELTSDNQGRTPKLRFPEFRDAGEWLGRNGNLSFQPINVKRTDPALPVLAITQEHGPIPRDMIDYHVSVTNKSLENYKTVEKGDFIISLRSFEGGIERSNYKGICSPAYIILRMKSDQCGDFYRHYFKSPQFIRDLNRNLEGLRDGKMVSYAQFSELVLPTPPVEEQQKIAECISSIDGLIAVETDKLAALKDHKKGLMQQLFPAEGETTPRLRFPEFQDVGEWEEKPIGSACHLYQPETLSTSDLDPSGQFPVYGANGIIGRLDRYNHEESEIAVTCRGATCGEVLQTLPKAWINGNAMVVRPRTADLSREFLFQFLKYDGLQSVVSGSAQPQITRAGFSPFLIKYPKELEQRRMVGCLSTIDDLIGLSSERLSDLKTHKSGLLQQLFLSPAGAAE